MDIKKLQQNCQDNGFELISVSNKTEALECAKGFIKKDMSVGLGGSISVEEIGLYSYLVERKDILLFNQYERGISEYENLKRRKSGMTADIFITSVNAVTELGELVNCDGSGNRVAAQIFGSKKLLLIVGVNKIVKDLKAGFERIEKIAAVKNAERLNEKALSYGKAPTYDAKGICKKWSVIAKENIGRITIILVNEPLGF